jgi:hypothetical protein
MALIEVKIGGITVALGVASTGAMEATRIAFANPYLACVTCGRRAVGSVNATVNALTGAVLPSTRNWPCYHANGRLSLCDNWVPTAGCQHTPVGRAAHGRPKDTDMNQIAQAQGVA